MSALSYNYVIHLTKSLTCLCILLYTLGNLCSHKLILCYTQYSLGTKQFSEYARCSYQLLAYFPKLSHIQYFCSEVRCTCIVIHVHGTHVLLPTPLFIDICVPESILHNLLYCDKKSIAHAYFVTYLCICTHVRCICTLHCNMHKEPFMKSTLPVRATYEEHALTLLHDVCIDTCVYIHAYLVYRWPTPSINIPLSIFPHF